MLVGDMTRTLLSRQIPQLPLLGGPRSVAIMMLVLVSCVWTVHVSIGAGRPWGSILVASFVLVVTVVASLVNVPEPRCVLHFMMTPEFLALPMHRYNFVVVPVIMTRPTVVGLGFSGLCRFVALNASGLVNVALSCLALLLLSYRRSRVWARGLGLLVT